MFQKQSYISSRGRSLEWRLGLLVSILVGPAALAQDAEPAAKQPRPISRSATWTPELADRVLESVAPDVAFVQTAQKDLNRLGITFTAVDAQYVLECRRKEFRRRMVESFPGGTEEIEQKAALRTVAKVAWAAGEECGYQLVMSWTHGPAWTVQYFKVIEYMCAKNTPPEDRSSCMCAFKGASTKFPSPARFMQVLDSDLKKASASDLKTIRDLMAECESTGFGNVRPP